MLLGKLKNNKMFIIKGNEEHKKFKKLSLFFSKKNFKKKNWSKYTCVNTA